MSRTKKFRKTKLRLKQPEEDLSEHWLCACGNYIEDGLHCILCGREPPWGCPCSGCQDGETKEEYDFDSSEYYSDSLY